MASRIVVKYQGKTYIGEKSDAITDSLATRTIGNLVKGGVYSLKLIGGDVLVLGTEATQRAAFIVQGVNNEPNGCVVSEKEAEA